MKRNLIILFVLSVLSALSALSLRSLAQAAGENAYCQWNAVDEATSYECKIYIENESGGWDETPSSPTQVDAPTTQGCNFTAEPGKEYQCQVTPKYIEGACDVSGLTGSTTNTCQPPGPCSYYAKAYVKDENDQPFSSTDGFKLHWSNSNGESGEQDFNDSGEVITDVELPPRYQDTTADVQLVLPTGYTAADVVGWKCTSSGSTDCPAVSGDGLAIDNFDVKCGASYVYGWKVKRKPAPAPECSYFQIKGYECNWGDWCPADPSGCWWTQWHRMNNQEYRTCNIKQGIYNVPMRASIKEGTADGVQFIVDGQVMQDERISQGEEAERSGDSVIFQWNGYDQSKWGVEDLGDGDYIRHTASIKLVKLDGSLVNPQESNCGPIVFKTKKMAGPGCLSPNSCKGPGTSCPETFIGWCSEAESNPCCAPELEPPTPTLYPCDCLGYPDYVCNSHCEVYGTAGKACSTKEQCVPTPTPSSAPVAAPICHNANGSCMNASTCNNLGRTVGPQYDCTGNETCCIAKTCTNAGGTCMLPTTCNNLGKSVGAKYDCTSSERCCLPSGDYHNTCNASGFCVSVPGAGIDECTRSSECIAPTTVPTSTPTSVPVTPSPTPMTLTECNILGRCGGWEGQCRPVGESCSPEQREIGTCTGGGPCCAAICNIRADSLSIDSANIAVGETVTINVNVYNVTDLYGIDLQLRFNPAILEVQDADPETDGIQIEAGPFLDVGQGFVAMNSADNKQGKIHYAMTLLNPAEAVSGSGTLIKIKFKGIAEGTSPITFASALLSDRPGVQIPIGSLLEGEIAVVPPPGATDLNGNGLVDSGDYTIVAQNYGQSGENLDCDANKDGVCNALDVSLVLSNFGRSAD